MRQEKRKLDRQEKEMRSNEQIQGDFLVDAANLSVRRVNMDSKKTSGSVTPELPPQPPLVPERVPSSAFFRNSTLSTQPDPILLMPRTIGPKVVLSAYRGNADKLIYELSHPDGMVSYFDIPAELIVEVAREYPVLLQASRRVEASDNSPHEWILFAHRADKACVLVAANGHRMRPSV